MSDVPTEGADGVAEPQPGEPPPDGGGDESVGHEPEIGDGPTPQEAGPAEGVGRRFGLLHLLAALCVGAIIGSGLGWAIGHNQGEGGTQAAETTGTVGSGTAGTEPAQTELPTSTTAPTTTTTTTVESAIGTEFQSGDIFLTVTGVTESPTLERNDNGDIIQQPAQAGGHFVSVSTTGRNESSEALDLTCSYYIATNLVDSEGREYEPVDDLYQIPGNPECNAQLNPGFGFTMTWPYMVPTDAEIVALRFQDVVALDSDAPEVDIPIQVSG